MNQKHNPKQQSGNHLCIQSLVELTRLTKVGSFIGKNLFLCVYLCELSKKTEMWREDQRFLSQFNSTGNQTTTKEQQTRKKFESRRVLFCALQMNLLYVSFRSVSYRSSLKWLKRFRELPDHHLFTSRREFAKLLGRLEFVLNR